MQSKRNREVNEVSTRMTGDVAESKKIKRDDICTEISLMKRDLNELKESIAKIQKKNVLGIVSVNAKMNIPIGIWQTLTDAFMCKICHQIPMKPPLIFTECCKAVVGCEECVNK